MVQGHGPVLKHPNGSLYGVVTQTIEVTVLYNMLEALRGSNDNYNFILFSVPSFLIVYQKGVRLGSSLITLQDGFLNKHLIPDQRTQFLSNIDPQLTLKTFKN